MFEKVYGYNFPTLVRFGAGAIKELATELKAEGLQIPLLVGDPIIVKLDFFQAIVDDLCNAGLKPTVFSDVHKNPVESDVLKGVDSFHNNNCDAIIGIGGGVPMDVARAIALKAFHDRPLFDYEDSSGGWKFVTEKIPSFYTVPTTSGTGSEVGRSTVISDDKTHQKKILFSARLMAKKVFADPLLTMELPASITAATGMDALTHNLEAFLSKGYHPMADGMALEAIRMIHKNLEKAVNNPDLESRAEMMMASLMGATAFQKGLGIVHSLAHPLSTMFDAHHGLANAVMLEYGMEFNYLGFESKFDRIAAALNLGSGGEVIDYLRNLNSQIGITGKLKDFGVEEKHLNPLADLALSDACHPCNPKEVTLADFKAIYAKALNS